MHGRLVTFHFGYTPIILRTVYRVVLGGFAIKRNILSFDSSTLNYSLLQLPNGTHDWLDRKMSGNEIKLINSAIKVAKANDRIPNLTMNIRDFEAHDPDQFCFYNPDTYPCKEFRISCKSASKINDN